MRRNLLGTLARRRAAAAGHHRLRRDGHPRDRERAPRRPSHGVPRRARPGEVAHHPRPAALARSRHPGRRGLPDQRRPAASRSAKRCRRAAAAEGDALAIAWIGPEQRYGEKLATPDVSIADLIGEIDPIKVAEGRYLADEETIHYGLIPRSQPRHLRHQRAARPHREGAGRPLQPDGGEGRPDQRLPDPPAARRGDRRQRQPRGLHQPRPHHHAAEGPLRRPDPHPLPAHAWRTRSPSWSRSCRARSRRRRAAACRPS